MRDNDIITMNTLYTLLYHRELVHSGYNLTEKEQEGWAAVLRGEIDLKTMREKLKKNRELY